MTEVDPLATIRALFNKMTTPEQEAVREHFGPKIGRGADFEPEHGYVCLSCGEIGLWFASGVDEQQDQQTGEKMFVCAASTSTADWFQDKGCEDFSRERPICQCCKQSLPVDAMGAGRSPRFKSSYIVDVAQWKKERAASRLSPDRKLQVDPDSEYVNLSRIQDDQPLRGRRETIAAVHASANRLAAENPKSDGFLSKEEAELLVDWGDQRGFREGFGQSGGKPGIPIGNGIPSENPQRGS